MTSESKKQKTVLIQIISEQTLPNLACVKAINPDKIWSLYTKSEKMEKKARIIEAFISKYALCPDCRKYSIQNPSPSIKEVSEIVETLVKEEKKEDEAVRLIVNYTGGRKPMSIGAYYAAQKLGAEAIYTEDGKTISGGENNAPLQVVPAFSIEEMLDAQGYEEHTSETITENRLNIAREIYGLRISNVNSDNEQRFVFYPAEKEKEWGLKLRKWENRQDFMNALTQVENYFQEVIKFSNLRNGLYENALRLCEQENWLVKNNGNYKISSNLIDRNENSFRIYAKLSFANNFLDGGWWEILVAKAFQEQFGEENVLWSLKPQKRPRRCTNMQNSQENHGENEDDVLAVHDNRLYVVSCKAGFYQNKFAETLGQLCSRAKSLGGHQAIPVFAYTHLNNLHPDHRAYGNLLGIRFVGTDDIFDPERFSKCLNQKN